MGDQGNRSGVWPASKGSIRISFWYRGRRHREFVKLPPTKKNLAAWEARRLLILQEISEDRFDYAKWFPTSRHARGPRAGTTVKALLETWLRAQEKVLEETSLRKLRQTVDNVLVPAFGALTAGEFRPGHVQDWIDGHELTRKTTSNYLWPLRQAFARAVHVDRVLAEDPLVNYKVRRRRLDRARAADRTADPFFDDELRIVIPVCQADLAPMVRLGIWSGLRLEELLELHWEDVDLVGKRIHVRRARVGRISKGPKTASSQRFVTLLPEAERALQDAKAHSWVTGMHVFLCLRTGRPWSDDALRDAWRRACRKAGVRYRAPKHWRHTYAHRMLTAGEDIAAISAELGHRDLAVTARVYAGFLAELKTRKFGDRAVAEYGGGILSVGTTVNGRPPE